MFGLNIIVIAGIVVVFVAAGGSADFNGLPEEEMLCCVI